MENNILDVKKVENKTKKVSYSGFHKEKIEIKLEILL